MRDTMSNELDLVFDRQPTECPAVVKERLLRIDKDELSSDMWTNCEGFNYLVSRQDLYVWKDSKKNTSKKATVLSLPASGLIYSVRSVVVYRHGKSAGVLAISGEGILRHWPNISSGHYVEQTLDLGKEVVLAVHLMVEPGVACSPNPIFLVTTTTGSVLCIKSYSLNNLSVVKIGGTNQKSIGRRLSSIIFGASSFQPEMSYVMNSILCWREGEEAEDEGEETMDPVALTISSTAIAAFDIKNKSTLWSFPNNELQTRIHQTFDRISHNGPVDNVRIWILDAIYFREGVLVLSAATHATSSNLTFFLAHLEDPFYHSPRLGWSSNIPVHEACSSVFDMMDDKTFVGKVKLAAPEDTASGTSNDRTDGVLILYDGYVQSVYLPDDLQQINHLPLNKMTESTDKMIGNGCDRRYCYVMTSTGVISALRLLPKGFDESTGSNDVSLVDIITDFSTGSADMQAIQDAFRCFASKDIVAAGHEMDIIKDMASGELTTLVCKFVLNHINMTDPDSATELELKNKKKICHAIILFLKHMNIYEKVCQTKISQLIGSSSVWRAGGSILAEMNERVNVAIAIREWQCSNMDNGEALEHINKSLAQANGMQGDADCVVLAKLALIDQLPAYTVKTVTSILRKTKNIVDRIAMLLVGSDLFQTFSNAISACRRSHSSVYLLPGEVVWTNGAIAEAFNDMALLLLKEMSAKDITKNDFGRLKECVVRLTMFSLEESEGRPDGHPVLMTLYEFGEEKTALDLAERFKDFKVLCQISLEYEKAVKSTRLDSYKMRFANDDFDIYLCSFLATRNLNDELLEQKGDRVDGFLSKVDNLRWRRELQNNQYLKAAVSLKTLAAREEEDVTKQKNLYSLAKLSALCDNQPTDDIVDECNFKLQFIQYQNDLPPAVVQMVYPDNPGRPLTVEELIELYKIAVEDDVDLKVLGSAVGLIAHLRQMEDSSSLKACLAHVWKNVLQKDDWQNVDLREVDGTVFAILLNWIAENGWSPELKTLALPNESTLKSDVEKIIKKNARLSSWIKKLRERTVNAIKV